MKLLFLPGSQTSPAARFRVWQFVQPLFEMGHQIDVRVIYPDRQWASNYQKPTLRILHSRFATMLRLASALMILRDIAKYDVVFMNRDLVPEIKITFLEPWISRLNPRLIFDFDDAIHISSRGIKLRKILPHFAWVTPGNEYLASFARQVNTHVSVWPTVIDTERYHKAMEARTGPVRIGWSGSRSTTTYSLPLLEPVLCKLAEIEDFEFIVIADVDPQIKWPGVKIRFIQWTPGSEVEGLQEIDIGLMPLKDEPFERGKCGLKALQYGAVGIPALVSPVGVNREIILHGESGYHCKKGEEWIEYLRKLIHSPALRQQMGERSRERVIEYYSINSLLPQMLEVFSSVANTNYG